jgi:hypothetical protein
MRGPRSRAAGLALALAVALPVFAQDPGGRPWPPATVRIFPIAGTDTVGSMTIVEREHRLAVDLKLTQLPANQPFTLHFADEGRCYAGPDAAPAAHAFVIALPELRADASGAATVHVVLESLTLEPGTGSIARYPVGIYTDASHGGTALACGDVSLNRTITTNVMPGPAASLDDARACMDSDDRIVTLDRRRDADDVAVDASRTADERLAALQVQATHEAQLQAYLKTHDQVCGKLRIGARERAAAASAAR